MKKLLSVFSSKSRASTVEHANVEPPAIVAEEAAVAEEEEDIQAHHVDDYMGPRKAYVKPAALLRPVPPAKGLSVVTPFPKVPKTALGGVWDFSLSNWSLDSRYFVADDWVILEVSSSAPFVVRVGPFPLGKFPGLSVAEFPFTNGHNVTMHLKSASGNELLAHECISFSVDVDEGSSQHRDISFTLNYREGRSEPNAGITGKVSVVLRHIERNKDAVLEQIFAATGYGDAVLVDQEGKVSFRLTMNGRYNGDWWALTSDNKARKEVSVPHSGGVKQGHCSGVSCDGHPDAYEKYGKKPFVEFLKAYSLCKVLPRLHNWQEKIPTLKLVVLSREQRSRRYNQDVAVFYSQLLMDGQEVKPWTNFDTWNIAHPVGDHVNETEFDTWKSEEIEETKLALETALNKVVHVWVDIPNSRIVVYGGEAVAGEVALRGMHVTIPVSQEFVAKYLSDVPAPQELKF